MRVATTSFAMLLCLAGTPALAQTVISAATPFTSEDQKTIYALGLSVGKSLGIFNLTKNELDVLKSGLTDTVLGKPPKVDIDTYGPKIQDLATARHNVSVAAGRVKGITYLAQAEKEPGAAKLPSGVIYTEIKAGAGTSPTATDTVKVNYRGTLYDGKEFDSSAKHGGEPASFPLNGVIRCWSEGVQKMKPGGKAKLVCPANTAYGDNSQPSIPPGSTLIFEVELLSVGAK